MDWARIARRLAEGSFGHILPTKIERMTIDQALTLLIPAEDLGCGPTSLSVDEAVKAGVINLHGKTGTEMALERAAAKRAAEAASRRKRRRGNG